MAKLTNPWSQASIFDKQNTIFRPVKSKTCGCVLRRVAGWVAVAGMMKLLVMKWIIPENSLRKKHQAIEERKPILGAPHCSLIGYVFFSENDELAEVATNTAHVFLVLTNINTHSYLYP